jgi:PmbA protein
LDAQGAVPLETGGEMAIVFRPTAYAELIGGVLMPSFIGDAAQRGESAFTGKEGQAVAASSLSMVDDPLMPGGIASDASDAEGVPSRRNALIDGGELVGFLYDTFHANLYGVGSTASASRGSWKSQPEADVSNVIVQVPSRGSLEDLISEIDRGLVVHDVMGVHTSNRQTLDFSLNTTMPFEVRKGEVVGVRRPAMLGGNLGDLLMRTLGGGGEARQVPEGGANIVVPWIAAEGVTVTP